MKNARLLLLLIIGVIGCSRLPDHPADMPDLTPCIIEVIFGGERPEGVGVQLLPVDQSNRWSAGGKTDSAGKAIMKTATHYNGVVPGTYWVIFQLYDEPELGIDGMPLPAESLIPIEYSQKGTIEPITVTKGKSTYLFEPEGKEQ